MLKGDKGGQFYLLAAIIIVGVFVGVVALSNYSFKKTSSEISSIGDELRYEGERVLDYDSKNSAEEFYDFAANYSGYVGSDFEIYYIIERGGNQEVFTYSEGQRSNVESYSVEGSVLTLSVDDREYEFGLEEGDDFHFLIIEEKEDERYVVQG